MGDGRALEVDAWGVPGGRMVTVGERTEQARLAALRRQLTGSAARHLQAPVSEVQAIGSDLLGQVPATAAPAVRRVLAAGTGWSGSWPRSCAGRRTTRGHGPCG